MTSEPSQSHSPAERLQIEWYRLQRIEIAGLACHFEQVGGSADIRMATLAKARSRDENDIAPRFLTP